ncbi:hypothetical protein [Streptomyces lydicus]|uniref:hypothetical protein n=1 Tax=Streptomyces lydicus TaxID=47763 RepID=UPI0009822DF2|nr:hypothetical protein [Streptomyces lydicus]
MSTREEPTGRQALAAQLGKLLAELRGPEKSQKAVVDEANRRRRTAAGRPKDEPWPRRKGGEDLSPKTLNDWLPKQPGSKEPSVPRSFEALWSVVEVMLRWTGQLRDKTSENQLHRYWRELYAEAQRGTSLDEEVRGYLEAARKAAEQHPYLDILGQIDPPSLAKVHVRQRSRPAVDDADAEPGNGRRSPADSQDQVGTPHG